MFPLIHGVSSTDYGPYAEYQGTEEGASASGAITYTDAPIGLPSISRVVVVAIQRRSDSVTGVSAEGTVSSVTIGGNAATIVVNGQDDRSNAAIAYLAVPSGTTATISAQFNGNEETDQWSISVWTLRNVTATPEDSGLAAENIASSISITLDTVEGGVAIAALTEGGPDTQTWTGMNSSSAEYTAQGGRFSGNILFPSTTAVDHTVEADLDGSSGNVVLAVVSWA